MKNHQSLAFSDEDLVPVLKRILIVIPIAAILIGISNLLLGRYLIALSVFTIPIFSFICYQLLTRGWVQFVIYSMILLVASIVTIAGFLGNGIHETAIIAFPVIILLSTFLLNGKGILIASGIVIFCLALMSFGQMYGLFPTRPLPEGNIVDLIGISCILSIDIVLIYYLTSKTKHGLQQAQQEVEAQQIIQARIRKNLDLKTDLLREIHHRVKNNLSLINSLIDLEIMASQKEREDLQILQRRIQAIARVHDPLFQSTDYKEVNIKEYLERLLIAFGRFRKVSDNLASSQIAPKLVPIDKAIPLGIILHELMSKMNENSKLSMQLSFREEEAHFSFDSGAVGLTTESEMKNDLIEIMSNELNSMLVVDASKTTLVFDVRPASLPV